MGYAVIGKLRLSPIEGAKTLQMGNFGGLPFVVGKDITEDDLLVIFMPDGRISEAYAAANDCIDRGKGTNGEKLGGFFGKNRKVRSLKLMSGKVMSMGYVASLESLRFAGDISHLKEGDVVDTFQGMVIAEKFELPKNPQHVQNAPKQPYVPGFNKHPETEQFYNHFELIRPGDILYFLLKIDGTSARYGHLQAFPTLKWWQEKLLQWTNKLTGSSPIWYREVAGTRNVVLNLNNDKSWFGTHQLWLEWAEYLRGRLLQGEVLYGEIAGWQSPDKAIQTRGGIPFDYGIEKGKTQLFVYNLRQTVGSYSWDCSWSHIVKRANELGLPVVPELHPPVIFDGNYEALKELVYSLSSGPDLLGKHIREGLCIRVENPQTMFILKSKSPAYYELESKSKDEAKEADIEEAQE